MSEITFSDECRTKANWIKETNEIAYGSIILYLSDQIVRKVDEHKAARALWIALHSFIPSYDFTK